jgi:hypothetical protein
LIARCSSVEVSAGNGKIFRLHSCLKSQEGEKEKGAKEKTRQLMNITQISPSPVLWKAKYDLRLYWSMAGCKPSSGRFQVLGTWTNKSPNIEYGGGIQ